MTRSWPSGRPVPPNRPADRQRAKTVSDAAPLKEQHLLWWGGLPGALALVLTLALPAERRIAKTSSSSRSRSWPFPSSSRD